MIVMIWISQSCCQSKTVREASRREHVRRTTEPTTRDDLLTKVVEWANESHRVLANNRLLRGHQALSDDVKRVESRSLSRHENNGLESQDELRPKVRLAILKESDLLEHAAVAHLRHFGLDGARHELTQLKGTFLLVHVQPLTKVDAQAHTHLAGNLLHRRHEVIEMIQSLCVLRHDTGKHKTCRHQRLNSYHRLSGIGDIIKDFILLRAVATAFK